MRTLAAIAFCLLSVSLLPAQRQKREPLSEAQQRQIAEASIDPVARVNLYVKFLDARSETIKGLIPRAQSTARSRRIDGELQDFTALLDELGDNLDVYGERKADIRKSFKGLNEAVARWQETLRSLPSEPAFKVARAEAIESLGDLAEQANKLTAEQEAYFKTHKDESGQDRWEPK